MLLAGCASAGSQGLAAPPAAAAPLATTMTVAGGGTWAIVAMGGPAADENRFWELFTRPAGSTEWALDTPPGVADNGGLVASGSGGALTVAFRPSQGLTFSPLATTSDNGKTWGTGLLDADVAAVPDALATQGGKMLALLDDGAIDQVGAAGAGRDPAGRAWRRRRLRRGPPVPGRRPDRGRVYGVRHAARRGILRPAGHRRHLRPHRGLLAGRRPAAPGGAPVRVLRLAGTPTGDTALLASGTGSAASLLGAWTSDGTHWTTSVPLSTGTRQVLADGTGPGGSVWVLLTGGRAETIAGPGAPWQQLPAPPPATAALAVGPGGSTEALSVAGASLTVYQLTPAGTWNRTQAITVPIQYGSSS